jgi:hypothetical protein
MQPLLHTSNISITADDSAAIQAAIDAASKAAVIIGTYDCSTKYRKKRCLVSRYRQLPAGRGPCPASSAGKAVTCRSGMPMHSMNPVWCSGKNGQPAMPCKSTS